MSRQLLLVLLACVSVAVVATALGARTEAGQPAAHKTEVAGLEVAEAAAPAKVVQVSGRLRLVGSSTLPELVLRGEGKQWYIAREEVGKLHALQQQLVTLEGEETIQELTWANGRPAGKRRYLRNIQILSVEP